VRSYGLLGAQFSLKWLFWLTINPQQLASLVHINEIAVASSHRGRGIRRLLMQRIHQWGQAQDIAEIEMQVWERNDQAIGFYENLGYQMWRRTMRFSIYDRN
jgi:ribosomal protein S18 acetylase RimI-like enzyme